ncbi:hypothetical protein [Corynebacterium sp. Marseille-P3884]|uniref:hypothetical protein n=1 Tax=Corynebacterium sp. Marseille-P3884 TaxID=2495409 RepID=UPI001B32A858|nr:hypothetical protein [Corynebacterium sp. Marseille-P3884]MBP3948002.1 hypothetical protein [Corynebacterium sp. Marseille-P3884]
MDFGIDAPIAFDRVLHELEGVRSYPSMITPGVTVHNGKLGIGGCEFHVRATETPDGVSEYSIAMPGEGGNTFLEIPLLTSTARFTAALDEQGIPWADDGKSDIVLYEHWMAFFDDVGEITHVLWYNRELMTDVELLDAAFPPKQ